MAAEIATIRAHHLIRKHFNGNLMELNNTLRSLADLVLAVERHEVLDELDEDEQIRRIEAMRADIAKGNRIAQAGERFFQESVAEHERRQGRPGKRRDQNSARTPTTRQWSRLSRAWTNQQEATRERSHRQEGQPVLRGDLRGP